MPPVPVRAERTGRSIVAFRFVFAFALSVAIGSSAQGQPGLKGLRAVRTLWPAAAVPESPLCPCRGLERRTAECALFFFCCKYFLSSFRVFGRAPAGLWAARFSLCSATRRNCPGIFGANRTPSPLRQVLQPKSRVHLVSRRSPFWDSGVPGFARGSPCPTRDKARNARWSLLS